MQFPNDSWSALLAWVPQFITGIAASTPSLESVCTTAHVAASLPPSGFLQGISPLSSSVSAAAVTNYTVSASSTTAGAAGLDFCNVTFSYSHAGLKDNVGNTNQTQKTAENSADRCL